MVHNVNIHPMSQNQLSPFPNLIQLNLVDTDTEGIIKSVRIKRVVLFKSKRHLLLEGKVSKEIKMTLAMSISVTSLTFTKPSFRGLNPLKQSKIAHKK